MEEDVNDSNKSSLAKFRGQVEPQFIVQDTVMVWVGGQTQKAQEWFFSLQISLPSVKFPQILCILFSPELQVFA